MTGVISWMGVVLILVACGWRLIGLTCSVDDSGPGASGHDHLGNVGRTVKNSLDSLPAGRKTELFGWLTEEGRFAPDIGRLLEVLCEKLTSLGVPVARATPHVRTLHPEFRRPTPICRLRNSID